MDCELQLFGGARHDLIGGGDFIGAAGHGQRQVKGIEGAQGNGL